ncbi:anaerobic ribonucleoside-triphosphate reductase activating protein [Sulfurimonas autotrophica]|uniref:Anaerobic ribonucleoside-triphosphate reductase activating protein n=1 Tax=Sulfurimonas autotrophica (strain ATCC BAA-671 / DSM 16294 / JCM 11897 / OK10) TaxID=563040 RepID=E0UTS2_SULAO|nr:anaerobic ribonucleoside-triphosphate reductase activating protein [Sulfurimonas autotrophica]ADN08303.1 anaerobic ribonucleoside-triphosphate reductase activating protein [Sulfurimonas autotrophica DSM 16294]
MNTDSANSLKSEKCIYDITKFTHLDYPDQLACIFWFSGCNMRCDFCYNKDIVFAKKGSYTLEDALAFLRTREHLLDAVVLSGGEASSYDLTAFCRQIKKLGFLIKLDTNGTNYLHVKQLIDLELLDYVALDYKAPQYKFTQITHSNKYEEFNKTLDLLINSNIDFEVRTTLHADLLNSDDINLIIEDLKLKGYNKTYYIQEFLDTQSNIGGLEKPSKSFEKSQLSNNLPIIWR